MFSHEHIAHLIKEDGFWIVGGLIVLEGIGIPVPGGTALILAAIYAGRTHQLDIALLIVIAIFGTILGSSLGWWIGREAGYRLLYRYGRLIGLSDSKIKVGQYLFLRYGGKFVFLSRFIFGLHSLNAVLAGANVMPGPRFQLFNTIGAIVWAMFFGVLSYFLSGEFASLAGTMAIAISILLAIILLIAFAYARRYGLRLEKMAEQALPGPLEPP